MACRECHTKKVKCSKEIPCARCVRLSLVCVQHESKQGQRSSNTSSSRRSTNERKRSLTLESPSCHGPASQKADEDYLPKNTEDAALSHEVVVQSDASHVLRPDHYGMQYLVRSWVSFAFRRRSFALLARAGALATRCGISMDQIFAPESQQQHGMEFLYPFLLMPRAQQNVLGDGPLKYAELPFDLQHATGLPEMHPASAGNGNGDISALLGDRWIWIREMRNGVSRYFCSPAFERDVARKDLIEETYQQNVMGVIDLFLPEAERSKHIHAFAHQVSLHHAPQSSPMASRLPNLQLRTRLSRTEQIQTVDQVSCLAIVDLDHSFYFIEYIRQSLLSEEEEFDDQELDIAIVNFLSVNASEFDQDLLDLF